MDLRPKPPMKDNIIYCVMTSYKIIFVNYLTAFGYYSLYLSIREKPIEVYISVHDLRNGFDLTHRVRSSVKYQRGAIWWWILVSSPDWCHFLVIHVSQRSSNNIIPFCCHLLVLWSLRNCKLIFNLEVFKLGMEQWNPGNHDADNKSPWSCWIMDSTSGCGYLRHTSVSNLDRINILIEKHFLTVSFWEIDNSYQLATNVSNHDFTIHHST